MFLCRLDAEQKTLSYTSAGHPPALVIGRDGEIRQKLKRTGIPLGMQPDTEYHQTADVQLEPGDIVVLLTDGAEEAVDADGQFFGLGGVARIVNEHRDRPAEEIVQTIYREVKAFSEDPKDLDDVTAIVLKVLD